MTAKAPADVYPALQATLESYIAALDRYTDEQFAQKPAEDVWSLGQMYEHLYTGATFFFMANIRRCLERRKGQEGGELNEYGRNLYKYNGFPPIKIKIPEVLRGPEPVAKSREDYKSLFAGILTQARAFIEPVTEDDGTYKTLQPAFGYMTAREWYHLMEMHFRHHLRQQKELEVLSKV